MKNVGEFFGCSGDLQVAMRDFDQSEVSKIKGIRSTEVLRNIAICNSRQCLKGDIIIKPDPALPSPSRRI